MGDVKKILSIDGGGIRGIIPALVLAEIEKRTNKRIADMFDLIAGTSTGGILALGLTIPGPDGRPKYTARDLVNLYEKEGQTIFPHCVRQRLRARFWSLFEEKYSDEGIHSIMEKYFGEAYFRDALTEILITSYDIERRKPHFFKRWREKENKVDNFRMVDIARATSAAPTYFEPYKLPTNDEIKKYHALIDGGVFANNPSVCAFAEALRLFGQGADFLFVSLGTGEMTRPILYDEATKWGLASWARPIMGIMFDGVSDSGDYQLQWVLNEGKAAGKYIRFQCRLDRDSDKMDNASGDNLRKLRLEAENMIDEKSKDLDALCAVL
jgi:patatin-like phospholipase/acyl hydrolase